MMDNVKIPKEILDLNRNFTLAAEVTCVSILGFLVSTDRKLKFSTIEHVPLWTPLILIKSLNGTFNFYHTRGFKVTTALMDLEYEPLRVDIKCLILNTTAASEYVPEIERQ
jgi:hypothetical protein